MSSAVFGRLVTAMVTPFDADGAVDLGLAGRLAHHLVEHGSDALVVCGTTGESPTLSWDEQHALLQAVHLAVAGKAKVLAGTGSNCTAEAVEATRQAAALGADGALVVVPYYNKPPQEGMEAHFAAVAEACSQFRGHGIRAGLFIDADERQIEAALRTGTPVIELHTGGYADATTSEQRAAELYRIANAARMAAGAGLEVHAGHGLNYHNVEPIAAIPEIVELNIGHAIVARALFTGLAAAVADMKNLLRDARST